MLLILLLLEILEPLLLGHQQLLLLFYLLLLSAGHIPQLLNAQLVRIDVAVHSMLLSRPLLHADATADLLIVRLMLLLLLLLLPSTSLPV
jgi:hypothetical protein